MDVSPGETHTCQSVASFTSSEMFRWNKTGIWLKSGQNDRSTDLSPKNKTSFLKSLKLKAAGGGKGSQQAEVTCDEGGHDYMMSQLITI